MLREHLLAAALSVAIAGLPAFAVAADTYPVKPIRLVIPTAAGGGMDLVGRLLAKKLEEKWLSVANEKRTVQKTERMCEARAL